MPQSLFGSPGNLLGGISENLEHQGGLALPREHVSSYSVPVEKSRTAYHFGMGEPRSKFPVKVPHRRHADSRKRGEPKRIGHRHPADSPGLMSLFPFSHEREIPPQKHDGDKESEALPR